MLLIARRYLLSPKSHSVVNVICCVSLISLLLPVAAVIVLLSVFNGFGEMIDEMSYAVESSLTVEPRQGRLFERDEIDTIALRGCDGVADFSFVAEELVLLKHGSQSGVVTLRGVDRSYVDVVDIEQNIRIGEFVTPPQDEIVVGSVMASNLGIRSLESSMIEILSLKTNALQSLIPMWQYEVDSAQLTGIVLLDQESDERLAYTSQQLMDRMMGGSEVATRLMIEVEPKYRSSSSIQGVQRRVESIIGEEYSVKRREEMNPATYDIVRYEKLGIMLICTMVMMLASFSLLGALAMLIIEKRGDIATLRAMGCSMQDVKRIFIIEGGLISGVAIILGVIIGVGVTLAQQYIGFIELPSQSMAISYYPVKLIWGDVAAVVTAAVAISELITLLVVNNIRGFNVK